MATFTLDNNLLEKYLLGTLSITEIASMCNVSSSTVRTSIQNIIGKRTVGKQAKAVNHQAFNQITEESAYWAGFLMADGCQDGKRVRLGLSKKDIEHLYLFRDFVESEHKVYLDKNNICRLEFYSKDMCADLTNLGITVRKTYTAKASSDLSSNPNFWRGVIDGDGYLYQCKEGYPGLTLVGSENLMSQFREYGKNIVDNFSANITKQDNLYRVMIKGIRYQPLFDLLKGEPCLFRKWSNV